MAIGNAPNLAAVNSQAYQIALQFRSTAQQALAFQAYIVGLGQSGLVALGFASADATEMIICANYMASLAQVYQGTLQQGGTGGTGAILFNFQNALIPLTGSS
jgi:hypothetical protein